MLWGSHCFIGITFIFLGRQLCRNWYRYFVWIEHWVNWRIQISVTEFLPSFLIITRNLLRGKTQLCVFSFSHHIIGMPNASPVSTSVNSQHSLLTLYGGTHFILITKHTLVTESLTFILIFIVHAKEGGHTKAVLNLVRYGHKCIANLKRG